MTLPKHSCANNEKGSPKMKLAIPVALFVLAAMPFSAEAQSTGDRPPAIMAPPAQTPTEPPADPNYKPTTEFLSTSGKTSEVLSAAAKCTTWIAKYNDITRYVSRLEELEKLLGSFGRSLSNLSTALKLGTGDTAGFVADAQDNIQDVVITEAGCLAWGTLCPFYKAGMTVGTVLNYLPKLLYWDVNEQTISEVVGDFYAPYWGDFLNKSTVAQVEAGIAKMRADAQKARESAQRAHNSAQMCKAEEAKSAVEEILAKAKAKAAATPMTPTGAGLSAHTDAAINAGRAGADAANAAGNAQFMSTMQSIQEQALEQQRAIQQQQALQQQALRQQALQQQALQNSSAAPPKGAMPGSDSSQSSGGCVLTAADIAAGLVCVAN